MPDNERDLFLAKNLALLIPLCEVCAQPFALSVEIEASITGLMEVRLWLRASLRRAPEPDGIRPGPTHMHTHLNNQLYGHPFVH